MFVIIIIKTYWFYLCLYCQNVSCRSKNTVIKWPTPCWSVGSRKATWWVYWWKTDQSSWAFGWACQRWASSPRWSTTTRNSCRWLIPWTWQTVVVWFTARNWLQVRKTFISVLPIRYCPRYKRIQTSTYRCDFGLNDKNRPLNLIPIRF